ncbi:MAG: Bax inhibitor-1 family protein [Gammaproteobacteria bacterium]|jgi:FtsH-binding integral membrane protein
METEMQQILVNGRPVAAADAETRSAFIWRVYGHVALAILAFVGIESWLISSGYADRILQMMAGVSWMLILGAFMLIGWGATHIAHTVRSPALQYAALGASVVAWSIIFVPMLAMAINYGGVGVIESAATVTLMGVAALTAVVFVTKKDFSFLRGMLIWGGLLALVAILGGLLFGFELGTWFSVAMIGFAGAAVLYDTSNILHHYSEDQHVAAALQLFASIAMMFWYVLRLFMSRN